MYTCLQMFPLQSVFLRSSTKNYISHYTIFCFPSRYNFSFCMQSFDYDGFVSYHKQCVIFSFGLF